MGSNSLSRERQTASTTGIWPSMFMTTHDRELQTPTPVLRTSGPWSAVVTWAWSAERTCRGFASSGSRASALTAKGEGTDVSNHKLLAARDYERIRSVVDPALVLDWPQSSESGSGCTEDS